jgi:hypothetical protein
MTLFEFLDLSFDIEPGHADRNAPEYQNRMLRIVRNHLGRTDMARYQHPDWRDNINAADAASWVVADGGPLPPQLVELSGVHAKAVDIENSLPSERTRPLSRHKAQEVQILDELIRAGYDPRKLPGRPKPGGTWEPRQAAKQAFLNDRSNKWTVEIFDKAWKRLRSSGQIGEK